MYIIDKKYHVIPEGDLWPDPKNDPIGKILLELSGVGGVTTIRAISLRKELSRLMEIEEYYSFSSTASKYLLSSVGESAIYAVPKDKKGHLKRFRGKIVRLVCVCTLSSGWGRMYSVGIYRTRPR